MWDSHHLGSAPPLRGAGSVAGCRPVRQLPGHLQPSQGPKATTNQMCSSWLRCLLLNCMHIFKMTKLTSICCKKRNPCNCFPSGLESLTNAHPLVTLSQRVLAAALTLQPGHAPLVCRQQAALPQALCTCWSSALAPLILSVEASDSLWRVRPSPCHFVLRFPDHPGDCLYMFVSSAFALLREWPMYIFCCFFSWTSCLSFHFSQYY